VGNGFLLGLNLFPFEGIEMEGIEMGHLLFLFPLARMYMATFVCKLGSFLCLSHGCLDFIV